MVPLREADARALRIEELRMRLARGCLTTVKLPLTEGGHNNRVASQHIGGTKMVATKAARSRQRSKSGNKQVRGAAHAGGVGVRRGSANEGDVATKEAWSAVVNAVRSGKAQPVSAARTTRKALSNVARAGAKQSGVAADAIARATEAVLITAMSETRTAAKAAREAAKEVERSVGKALKAIKHALRQRAYAAIDKAAQEGHGTVKRIAGRRGRPRVPPR